VVVESVRQHLREVHGEALPVACFSDAVMKQVVTEDLIKSMVVADQANGSVLPAPAEEIKGRVSLTARVLSGFSRIARPEGDKDLFDLRQIKLSVVAEKLHELGTQMAGAPWAVTHHLLSKLSARELIEELRHENSPDRLRLTVDLALWRQVSELGGELRCMSCFNADWSERSFGLVVRDNTPAFSAVNRLVVEAFKARKGEIRSCRLVGADNAAAVFEEKVPGSVPDGIQFLLIPIRHGEVSFGTTIITTVPDAGKLKDQEFPQEIEWFAFKVGELFAALKQRQEATALTEASLPRAPRNEPVLVRLDKPFEAAGAYCKRGVVRIGDEVAVVFISDKDARGRSITNVISELAKASLPDVEFTTIDKIRWFEYRSGEARADATPQSWSFDEVHDCVHKGSLPRWTPADRSSPLVRAVSQLVRIPLRQTAEPA
jgi:hypothetical protein